MPLTEHDAVKIISGIRSGIPKHSPVEVDVVVSVKDEEGDLLTMHVSGRPPFLKMEGVLNGEDFSLVGHPAMLGYFD